ncbi:MAG: transcription/translation regulatory transformer protein RfaH [Oceanospirillaceae bacterium]|uniref:transcription termination/antitermination NusG family protein n=1 Tax=unclassified Thalassolituus TaxID=2624967 RepID=UPI000C4C3940|nr:MULTISPECIES: transcription termination/antitermination NusG family protein [unclassified Thalassolituus]MAS26407.1 transcription/translation regulatory transformer protein RfaH [Oceanospirillaceae bacterium]MAX97672.1 transcription/translation regulatory transformer protein RfaH [Oceanospirillaceae bacterium]MBL33808.1 transcription/translation regulatory transformer protein RfaH [Oceanospirillaceae bacterium]MBS51605.1 transcription/translation regulatory transformer protein RfaH [Oceanosp|tara:strand:+ start:1661 stop:2143 length:483 start_codon:yes stop_codon:yes gene_type:complete
MSEMDWHIVQTKPGQELRAEEHLHLQGAEVFCPRYSNTASPGKKAPAPLFPGYLFFRCLDNPSLISRVRSTRGVRKLLTFGNQPATLADDIVRDIELRCGLAEEQQSIMKGQRVRIESGPFRLYEAIFEEFDGEHRAIVFLTLLNQQQRLVLDLQELAVA